MPIILTKEADSEHQVCTTVTVTEATVFTFSGATIGLITPPGTSTAIKIDNTYDAVVAGDYIVCIQGACVGASVSMEPLLGPMTPTGEDCTTPSFVELCNISEITDLLQELVDKDDIQVDTEYVCNTDTNVWDKHTIVSINGLPSLPTITPTSTPCEDVPPATQDPEISWVDNCVNNVVERQLYQVQFVDNIAQPPVAIGSPIITNIACGEDVVSVDVEFVCNEDTNVYDQITTTTTNGVPSILTSQTLISCDLYEDIEYRRVCNDTTNKIDIVAIGFDENNVETVLSVTAGTIECPSKPLPSCVESQEWTYGIDNAGTIFTEDNTIEIGLSDGTSFTFDQPATTGWTPQMQTWGTEIQAAADAMGVKWFVETRYRDSTNPANLTGGGGFSGPPSLAISIALTNMVDRYVNIQICPGQPVPISAVVVASSNPVRVGYNLTTNGAVKGPLQRFFVCRKCGELPIWYLEDNVTLAPTGVIPSCYEPCGVIAQLPPPPESDCQFEIDVACDNNNSTMTVDFTNTITRRTTVCRGEQIAVDYFEVDPGDPGALIPYVLNGDFVDCATGQPVSVPVPDCSDFEISKFFTFDGVLDSELVSREWHDTAPVTDAYAGTVAATASGRAFRLGHDFSLPVSTTSIKNNLALNDTNDVAAELDIQVLDGYIQVLEAGMFRYADASEGYWAVELGECCTPLTLLVENAGFFASRSMEFYLPKGVHQIRVWNIDSGGSNSAASFGYSLDGGLTYSNNNNPPNILFGKSKINERCITAKICEDSGAIIDVLTNEVYDPLRLNTCSQTCTPSTCLECG